jgi:undecaprenyl-diphosphatase
MWTLLTFGHRRDPNARFFRVRREVHIHASHPMPVQGDGELLGETPLRASVVPGAVRVLAPIAEPGVESGIEPRRQHLRRIALRQRFDQRVATIWHVDAAVFLWINRLPRTKWLDVLMTEVSASMPHGEGWLLFLGIAMLFDLRAGWDATLAVVPAMWLTSLTVNYPIKAMFRRRRPFLKHEDVVVVGARPADTSFPSGHSAAAFAGALLLSFRYPEWSPLGYAIALLVGLSRIYLGVHFPLDVAVGAVSGMVLAAAYSAALGWVLPAPHG